ncbi:hypothetical protein TI04_03890 [Achromatium sp. WMS2]|nr:hypothetical protein TI04_03890 [Achromatium sp. WMS2]
MLDIILDALDSELGLFGYMNQDGWLAIPSMTRQLWEHCQIGTEAILLSIDSLGNSSLATAVLKKILVYSNNQSSLFPDHNIIMTRSIVVPIVHSERVIGVICVANKFEDYNSNDIALSQTIANSIAPILAARLAFKQEQIRRWLTESKLAAEAAALTRINAELKQSQVQILQMEKLSALGTLVGGVAHEVNNPLMGIHGYLDYAISKIEPGKPLEMLKRALTEVERVTRIVKNMLAFSRFQTADSTQTCNALDIIKNTVALLSGELRKADIKITMQIPEHPVQLHCSADTLQQSLLNLLINARDAFENSPGSHEITVKLENINDKLARIQIIDNGPGVPEAIKHKIFDPFFTTKVTGKGTGLGLSVSRQLLNNAGGSLSLMDAAGGGSIFSIELKLVLT